MSGQGLTLGLRKGEVLEIGGVRWRLSGVGRAAACLVGACGEVVLAYAVAVALPGGAVVTARRRTRRQVAINVKAPLWCAVVRCKDGKD